MYIKVFLTNEINNTCDGDDSCAYSHSTHEEVGSRFDIIIVPFQSFYTIFLSETHFSKRLYFIILRDFNGVILGPLTSSEVKKRLVVLVHASHHSVLRIIGLRRA